jgi:hypothetical protein
MNAPVRLGRAVVTHCPPTFPAHAFPSVADHARRLTEKIGRVAADSYWANPDAVLRHGSEGKRAA